MALPSQNKTKKRKTHPLRGRLTAIFLPKQSECAAELLFLCGLEKRSFHLPRRPRLIKTHTMLKATSFLIRQYKTGEFST